MNLLRAVFAAFLLATPASAQALLSSRVETGWTSNAEAAAGGASDLYVTQAHAIALAAPGLRGTIGFEGTRFSRLWRENDWSASATLETETAIAPDAILRGSFALSHGEEGRSIATPLGPLGLVIPTLSGTASIRAETLLSGALFGLDLAYAGKRPGDTRFEANLLPQARTEPRTDTITAGVDLIAPITPLTALAARAQYRTVLVAPAERVAFGRLPVSVARFGGGVDFGSGTPTGIVLRAGLDAIVSDPALLAPYAEADARLGLSDVLALNASLLAGVDVEDPADSYADWRLEARAGLRLTPATGFAVDAALFVAQRRSAALELTLETERGAELIARWAALDGVALEALARYRQVTGLAPTYEETRLALRISAAI